jgi:hypothetical protein
MFRRFLVTAGIIVWSGCSWGAAFAAAQDLASPLATAMPKLTFAMSVTAPAATPTESAPVLDTHSFSLPSSHLATMAPFYATTAVLQIMDVRSTLQVIKLGGAEANPMLKSVVSHPAVFVGVKAAIAALSIYSANKMAKHNKVGAIVTMVAMNSAYAWVVSHNMTLARTMAQSR